MLPMYSMIQPKQFFSVFISLNTPKSKMIQFHSNLGNNNIPFLDTGFENKLHNERVQNCFLLGFDLGSYAWEPIVDHQTTLM